MKFNFTVMTPLQKPAGQVNAQTPIVNFHSLFGGASNVKHSDVFKSPVDNKMDTSVNAMDDSKVNLQKLSRKSGSFESALPSNNNANKLEHKKKTVRNYPTVYHSHIAALHQKHKYNRRLKLQFDDQSFMDCGNINDFLSSSSLSSTDSETEETNESDHEGDDELTDWPGHEAMVNFASKNEFKRANKKAGKMPQIKQQDDIIQDDDTLMSADEVQTQAYEESSIVPTNLLTQPDMNVSKFVNMPSNKNQASHPINIIGTLGSSFIPSSSTSGVADGGYGSSFTTSYNHKQQPIESEMSGETSNPFLSSPNAVGVGEVREIRAGCRRIRERSSGFSIVTSFNEDLLRHLLENNL